MSLDGLSLNPLVLELQHKLAGGRIEKIFQPDKYTLILWVRQLKETLRFLVSAQPENPRIHLINLAPENPATPPAFCMLLRKHFEDGRIAAISQHELDRIVNIDVDVLGSRGEIVTKRLIVELMGKHSNIIFTQDGSIVDSIKRIGVNLSRHRQVLPGRLYIYPPGQERLNPLETAPDEFIQTLSSQTGQLSKAIISIANGIGPLTAKEIAWRAGIAPDYPVSNLDQADMASLKEAVTNIFLPLKNSVIEPCLMIDPDGRLAGLAAFAITHLSSICDAKATASMSEALETAQQLKGIRRFPEKEAVLKLVHSEQSRIKRKLLILHEDWNKAADADLYRKYADTLMIHLNAVKERQTEVTLPNLLDDSVDSFTIPLDIQQSPLENAQSYYAKYNKLRRATEQITEQLAQCKTEMDYLDSIAVSVENIQTATELDEIKEELAGAGYIKKTAKRRPAAKESSISILHWKGMTILFGKNNRQNDLVTFKHASPDDLWFHTKDIPGSHVVLKVSSGEPPQELIGAAAQLSAWFSKSRLSSNVPVDYTKRRNVKKPAGAKPGYVTYERQRTLYVTPDKGFIEELLNAKKV